MRRNYGRIFIQYMVCTWPNVRASRFCCCCQKFPLRLLLLFLLPDLVWLAIFIMLQLGDKQKQLNNQPMHTRTDGVSAITMSALSARCLSACLAVRLSFTYKAEYVHTCVRM